MPEQYLHGVELIEAASGAPPIQTVRSAVIGLIGTAPDADPAAFPLNTPVLIAGNRVEAAKLDMTGAGEGTLPDAVDAVFDQAGALIVVIRVEEDASEAATIANIIGGVDPLTGQYLGLQAFLSSQHTLGLTPKILIAPGFTSYVTRDENVAGNPIIGAPVVTELVSVAERLRAVISADGPNTTDAEAQTYRGLFATPRVYVVDPWSNVFDTAALATVAQPASARVAGIIAKSDAERGFWWSPSNREMLGITGAARAVDFSLGDPNCRANILNEHNVATIIRPDQGGYRLWGNRTADGTFLSVRRTKDMIMDSLQAAMLWAVDQNIVATYLDDVAERVNAYIRILKKKGALVGGRCWPNPDLNTPDQIASGKAYWDFDLGFAFPGEHLTFTCYQNDGYLTELLTNAA